MLQRFPPVCRLIAVPRHGPLEVGVFPRYPAGMGPGIDHRRMLRRLAAVLFAWVLPCVVPQGGIAFAAVGDMPRVDMSVVEPDAARLADPQAVGGGDSDYLIELKNFSDLEDRAERGDVEAQ